MSDLKLKNLTIDDRKILEAIYCDFQVHSSSPTTKLNLAGPVMTLLKSIIRQRTGIDPYDWAQSKLDAANMGIEQSFDNAGSLDTKSAVNTKITFKPPKGVYYFATSKISIK